MGSVSLSICCMLLCAVLFIQQIQRTESIGVCYGTEGNNLPVPSDVVARFKKCSYQKMRIFNPNSQIQQALQGQGISVAIGIWDSEVQRLANDQGVATSWVNTNIVPYMKDTVYEYLVVGNEVVPAGNQSKYVAPAMLNLYNAIQSIEGLSQLKVTTAAPMSALGVSDPPSASNFSDAAMSDMTSIIKALNSMRNGDSFLMVNAYPYFVYASDTNHTSILYANTNSSTPVIDGKLEYHSLIHQMLDAFYAALEKNGGGSLGLVVGETGWPSAGNGNLTTSNLSAQYNLFFRDHILGNGTPKRPNIKIDGFIYEMFDENDKSVGFKENFGLYQPNMVPMYPFC